MTSVKSLGQRKVHSQKKSSLWRTLIASTALVSASMAAQTTISQAQDGASSGGIDEIVITVRYRPESSQSVPQAVTAFNASMLEKVVAQDLRDIGPSTPNVHIQPVVTFPNSAAIHVRGMGIQGIESTEEPRAGISIDGVFYTRPTGTLFDLFDVESIEVLRGPQGTQFGKNSLSGGINIRTKRPSGEFGYHGEFTAGNYGRIDFRGAVEAPIIEDVLAIRVSMLKQGYDGHFKNRADDFKRINGEDVLTGRATIVYTPSEDFSLTLIGSIVDNDSDAPGGDSASDFGQILPFLFVEPDDGKLTIGRDAPSFHKLKQIGGTAIAEYTKDEWSLTSITGYYDTEDNTANDYDQSEFVFFPTTRDQTHDQFSQEVRVGWANETLDLTAGIYYLDQKHAITQAFPTLGPSADYTTQKSDSLALFGQGIYDLTSQLSMSFGVRWTKEEKEFTRHPGLFDPTITVDPDTHPSVQEIGALVQPFIDADDPVLVTGTLDTDRVTFKVGLDYQINDDAMVYGLFSQGFRGGSFGARASSALTVGPTKDETADNFEIGLKSEWLDNTLQVNLAGFFTQYDDLQSALFVPSADNPTGQETAVLNIAEAEIMGLELEAIATPTSQLTLQASVGWLDADFTDFCADLNGPSGSATVPTSDCGTVTALGDIVTAGLGGYSSAGPDGLPDYLVPTDNTHLKLQRAPEWQVYASAEYVMPIDDEWGDLTARLATHYESSFFTTGAAHQITGLNHPKGKTGDEWLLDSSLTWTHGSGGYAVRFWGKNLTNKIMTGGLTPTANFFNQHFYTMPRTWGVTLTVRG